MLCHKNIVQANYTNVSVNAKLISIQHQEEHAPFFVSYQHFSLFDHKGAVFQPKPHCN